ncbi:MAG: YkgJ family cysteine cluster protein [Candidatus Adiutrix sp.]|nr:YkgJ family cysteine cluster protein [Candidatus Adiutrix sp.]
MAGGGEKIFVCRLCGSCCLGRGGVRLDEAGARAAADFLELEPAEFHRLYLLPGPPPWDIRLDPEGYCLFHQPGGRCLIHPVKPEICSLWPFLPALLTRESAFEEAKGACPGLRADLTWAEFKAAGTL